MNTAAANSTSAASISLSSHSGHHPDSPAGVRHCRPRWKWPRTARVSSTGATSGIFAESAFDLSLSLSSLHNQTKDSAIASRQAVATRDYEIRKQQCRSRAYCACARRNEIPHSSVEAATRQRPSPQDESSFRYSEIGFRSSRYSSSRSLNVCISISLTEVISLQQKNGYYSCIFYRFYLMGRCY
jgi:hypothetical protein